MKIEEPSVEILSMLPYGQAMRLIEDIGRTCYKSNLTSKPSDPVEELTIATEFVARLIRRGHESVLEHISVSFRVICDRGISHEIVRHRLASYTQESTRYCNYGKDKFGNEITVIAPSGIGRYGYEQWREAMLAAEKTYLTMIRDGITPEIARSVLPMSLKTELVMTMNLREWRHFIRMRIAKDAHPQMQEIAVMIYNVFQKEYPVIVDDITI